MKKDLLCPRCQSKPLEIVIGSVSTCSFYINPAKGSENDRSDAFHMEDAWLKCYNCKHEYKPDRLESFYVGYDTDAGAAARIRAILEESKDD